MESDNRGICHGTRSGLNCRMTFAPSSGGVCAPSLEHEPGIEVIAEASDGREAVSIARRERPHVVILDITMPNLNGIEAGRQISEMLPDTQIVILTVQADEAYLLSALKAGARGYVL